MISCPYRNTVNFSLTSQIHFCAKNTSFCPFKPMEMQMPKNPQKSPFLLEHMNPHLIHESLNRLHWSRQTTARSVHALLHNYTTKYPLVTMGCPKFSPKLPHPIWWSPPHLIHPSFDQLHSPSQTASGFNQPFCHSTLSKPNNRPTLYHIILKMFITI